VHGLLARLAIVSRHARTPAIAKKIIENEVFNFFVVEFLSLLGLTIQSTAKGENKM